MSMGFVHERAFEGLSNEWYTPRCVFDVLGIEFDLDPCSPGADIVPWIPAKEHFTRLDNGLYKSWRGRVWLNPPYGRDTFVWLSRLQQHGNGIALVFARTDTEWFHQIAVQADSICFIRRRIQFIKGSDVQKYTAGETVKLVNAGSPSCLIAFGKDNAQIIKESELGLITNFKAGD